MVPEAWKPSEPGDIHTKPIREFSVWQADRGSRRRSRCPGFIEDQAVLGVIHTGYPLRPVRSQPLLTKCWRDHRGKAAWLARSRSFPHCTQTWPLSSGAWMVGRCLSVKSWGPGLGQRAGGGRQEAGSSLVLKGEGESPGDPGQAELRTSFPQPDQLVQDTRLYFQLKCRDTTVPTNVCLVKAMVLPVVSVWI